jgi:hypothetical protein
VAIQKEGKMDSTRQHLEQQQARGTGLAQEFRQLSQDGSASAAELQDFLGQLKGRSPEEVMGAVAQSGLIQSTVMATFGCVALLVACTIVPYALSDSSSEAGEASAAVSAPATSAAAVTADATESAATGTVASSSSEPDLERAAEAMGIGGAEKADPNKNPLDNKLDKLLDGIE